VLFLAVIESSFYYYCSTGIYLFIYLFIRLAQIFYVIPGAVGELSQKERATAATADTMTPRILTTIKEEVYAIA
jgi:hypothetical protein